jgi:hypothetical protein
MYRCSFHVLIAQSREIVPATARSPTIWAGRLAESVARLQERNAFVASHGPLSK